jgi:repressor LexA
MYVAEKIKSMMQKQGYTQNRLAKKAQISQSGLSSILSGVSNPSAATLNAIARALDCTVAELLGETVISAIPISRAAVPIVGEIACGTPITAEQNVTGYADLPDGVKADFALICKGDSMSPTFIDGDIVLIRQQPEVEPGQIAAVGVGSEALLKHLYPQENGVLCVSDNPKYPPQFFPAGEGITVYGLAVGYVRIF